MTQELLEQVADVCNRLPFVRWDRFVESLTSGEIYGWIERDDGRSDFVVLRWESDVFGRIEVGYTTSSAERSEEVGRLIYGEHAAHYPCQRVDEHFGDLIECRTSSS